MTTVIGEVMKTIHEAIWGSFLSGEPNRLPFERFPISGDGLIDGTTFGVRWLPGTDRAMQWSISKGEAGEEVPEYVDKIATALATISDFINVEFEYLGSFESFESAFDAGAELNFMRDAAGDILNGGLAGVGLSPGAFVVEGVDLGGLVVLDGQLGTDRFEPGSEGFSLILHEIMHALGLKHPHDNGMPDTPRPTFSELEIGDLDQTIFSLMSYNDGLVSEETPVSWLLFEGLAPKTPMFLDVLALQALYGQNPETGAGESVYTLGDELEYRTIWDAGGLDLIDQSGSGQGWKIALPSGQLSALVSTRFGLALPAKDDTLATPGTLFWLTGDLENIKGSAFGDTLFGNLFDNRIAGMGGRDKIKGAFGDDTLFGGAANDVIRGGRGEDVIRGGKGADLIVGGGGNDALSGNMGPDTFVFVGNFGNDILEDFDTAAEGEVLDLSAVLGIRNWRDLKDNHLEEQAGNARISVDGSSILLSGVTVEELSKDDFVF